MIRLLKRILICISVLLGYIPLYASSSPADSLVDRYVNRLTKAVNSKIKADRNKSEKDYLLMYDDPAQTFYTDYVNNGQYFWFNGNSTLESQVRSLVNTVQAQTGTEHLYVVLASIYNYAAPEDVSDIKWSSVKAQNKYEIADINASESVWKSVIPKIRQKTSLLSTNSVLYIISYFTNINGTYKVSHRCFYHGSSSLVVNGFQINATDYVSKSDNDKNDQNSLRIGFLKQTIQSAANSIAKFNADFKQVNEDFAKLAADSRGMQFYNTYKDLCEDQLILKKLALLINSMDYDAYVAYLSDKKTGDGYYPAVFRGFYDNLYKFNENFKEITKLLPEITSPSQLVKALDVFSEGELSALKYPGRIRAITILNKLEELNDNSWWQVLNTSRWVNILKSESGQTIVSSEDLMIALISTTPDDQQPSLMEDLKGTDKKYKLLKDIFKKMDDEPVGEGNYSKLMGVLAPMVVKNATDKALDDLYTKNRIFTWENGKMKNIIQDETKAASATVTINGQSITLNPQFAFYQYTPKYDEELGTTLQKYGVGKPSWNPYKDDIFQPPPAPAGCTTCADIPTRIIGEDDALDPFDLIAIIPTSEINFGTGFSVEPDQITLLPSFFIQWYLKKVDNKEIKHNVNMTLAAVSLATGVGGFVSAATLGARILIVAETFFALTAIAGEEYPGFNNFMKENLGTTGYQIFKAVEFGVNLFAAGRGAAALGKGVINTAKKLSTSFLNLIKNNPAFLAKLRAAYPLRFQQLAAWMKNPDLGAVDLAAIANTATNVAKSASKTFSEVMAKYKIKFQVINETTVARASRLAEEGEAFRDPEALFLDDLDDLDGIGSGGNNGGGTSPGGNGGNGSSGGGGTTGSSGGGGVQTATAPKLVVAGRSGKFILNSAESKNLMKELALRQLVEATVEGQMSFQQIPEFAPDLLEALKAPTLPAKAASVKVFQSPTAQAVVVTAGEEVHLVYAEGEAQPIVSALIRARQSPGQTDTKKDEDECELCKQQPLICTLDAKASYGRKNEAFAKLCNLPEPTRLQVCARLDMLPPTDLDVFLQDLVVPKPPEAITCNGVNTYLADNTGVLTAAIVEAWTIYKEAGRTCLRVSPEHLRSLASAWTNARLKEAPYVFTRAEFVGIARAGASARSFAEKYDRTVFDNLQRVCNNLTATFVNMNKLKAKLQQVNSGATLEGFNFNMKFLGEYATAMNGGTLQFEDTQPSPGRSIDMTDARNQQRKTFYEFKSVQDIGSDFAEQFTKDLIAAAVIEQIKWVFDRTKMDSATIRTQVLNKLLATDGLAQLNTLTAAKKTLYFSGYDPLVGITDDDVRAFINANFETIFLVR